ncbi:hypothetical protein LM500008_130399 [Listeria monocytogenes]|nr:hypothetical protein LM500008_130399 [Listeria monocytogenes]CUK38423.1 hypothetical protein LM500172_120398 [Listeria monocytogenes]
MIFIIIEKIAYFFWGEIYYREIVLFSYLFINYRFTTFLV